MAGSPSLTGASWSGRRALRLCMQLLVLLNLVFTQITGAAGLEYLIPLYLLTIASPLLIPYQEKFVYRASWNMAVVGIFALLVQHATGLGLVYMLEDGLVLAALCQVHLLNNLRTDQAPDLLFFNSFLIAVVTGYLSQDLSFSFVFLAYAPVLVVGMALLCVSRKGGDLPAATVIGIARDAVRRSGVLLGVTLLVFLFFPRDFHRRGVFGGTNIAFANPADVSDVAFTDEVELGRSGRATATERIVMKVHLLQGSPADVPLHWRGATLSRFDGNGWSALTESERNEARQKMDRADEWVWQWQAASFVRSRPKDGARVSVEIVDPRANRLFTPLEAANVKIGDGVTRRRVNRQPDATLHYGASQFRRPTVHYEVTMTAARPQPGGRWAGSWRNQASDSERVLSAVVEWGDDPETARARREAAQMLARILATLPADPPQADVVEALRIHLEENHRFLMPGEEGAAGSLAEFLEGGAGGHCEYFATALVALLSELDIPARLVAGYRSEEWDDTGSVLTVRALHAHAWVEVLDPTAGWYAVDPSPAVDSSSASSGPSLWSRMQKVAHGVWEQIVGFDADRRDALLGWIAGLPGRFLAWAHDHPGGGALAMTSLGLMFALVRLRRRRGTHPAVRAYREALRRSGLAVRKGETPREVLARAQAEDIAEGRLTALTTATHMHEEARYGAV